MLLIPGCRRDDPWHARGSQVKLSLFPYGSFLDLGHMWALRQCKKRRDKLSRQFDELRTELGGDGLRSEVLGIYPGPWWEQLADHVDQPFDRTAKKRVLQEVERKRRDLPDKLSSIARNHPEIELSKFERLLDINEQTITVDIDRAQLALDRKAARRAHRGEVMALWSLLLCGIAWYYQDLPGVIGIGVTLIVFHLYSSRIIERDDQTAIKLIYDRIDHQRWLLLEAEKSRSMLNELCNQLRIIQPQGDDGVAIKPDATHSQQRDLRGRRPRGRRRPKRYQPYPPGNLW